MSVREMRVKAGGGKKKDKKTKRKDLSEGKGKSLSRLFEIKVVHPHMREAYPLFSVVVLLFYGSDYCFSLNGKQGTGRCKKASSFFFPFFLTVTFS